MEQTDPGPIITLQMKKKNCSKGLSQNQLDNSKGQMI